MLVIDLFAKLAAYACIGWVIEVLFTGIYSLFRKDKAATCTTYLWMGFVYGFAGLVLELVKDNLFLPWYLKPLVYLPLIYGMEGTSGFFIKKIIGFCPWNYGTSKWTPWGLIHLGYSPAWLLLGFLFDPISSILTKIVHFLAAGY